MGHGVTKNCLVTPLELGRFVEHIKIEDPGDCGSLIFTLSWPLWFIQFSCPSLTLSPHKNPAILALLSYWRSLRVTWTRNNGFHLITCFNLKKSEQFEVVTNVVNQLVYQCYPLIKASFKSYEFGLLWPTYCSITYAPYKLYSITCFCHYDSIRAWAGQN